MAANNTWRGMPLEDILSNGNISWTGEEILEHLVEAGYLIVAPDFKMPDGFADAVVKEAINIIQNHFVNGPYNKPLVDRLSPQRLNASNG